MEGNALPPQNLNPIPNNTEKKAVKGFTLLKMGVLEILFVGVVLFLFFGVLNYFNILSVSDAFPKYLSWLPRKDVPNGTSQPKNFTPASLPTPILTPAPDEAKKSANSLIEDILKSSLIPSNLTVGLQGTQRVNGSTLKSYGAVWKGTDEEIFIPTVKYNDRNQFVYRYLEINFPSFLNFDASSASNIVEKYFTILPPKPFGCVTTATGLLCSISWQENNANKGISLSNISGQKGTQIAYCEYHSNAPGYTSDSCGFNPQNP